MIKMSLPDIIDRYIIAELKNFRTGEDFSREMLMYEDEFCRYSLKKREAITDFLCRLKRVHTQIWDVEASIRSGEEDEMTLEQVGRRALMVRDLNRIRQQIKNEMVECFGDGFKDCKVNYGGK
jgi:hypothetical protein